MRTSEHLETPSVRIEPGPGRSGPACLGRPSLTPTRSDYLVALVASTAVGAIAGLIEPRLWDPLLVPVILAGSLAGADAVRMATRRIDILDPQAVLSVFALYFFVLAPLLQVMLGYRLPGLAHPTDLQPWLGKMAWYNLVGLVAFRLVLHAWQRLRPRVRGRPRWHADPVVAPIVFGLLSLLALACLVWVVWNVGGVAEYVRQARVTTGGKLEGYGWVLVIGESLPVLLLLGYVLRSRTRGVVPSWGALALVFSAYAALCFVTGGLRGSRGNLVYAVLIGAGIIHFSLRRIPGRVLVAAVLLGLGFMYLYGFYKQSGPDFLDDLAHGRIELAGTQHRNVETLLLGDLARTDVQAVLLWRREQPGSPFRARDGSTYVGDAALLVPRALTGERPEAKQGAGTLALYGLDPGLAPDFQASFIYGLAGEWILNFPVWTIPVAFALFAALCAASFRWCRSLDQRDVRLFFVAVVGISAVLLLSSDLDNALYALLKYALVPGVALTIVSRRGPRAQPAA